jgi:hypothetical protein
METIDLKQLSPQQKAALKAQFEAEERANAEQEKKIRADYDNLKNEEVEKSFGFLMELSKNIEEIKIDIFNQYGTLIAMKKEIYNLTDAQIELQQTHTFTNKANTKSIILGSNVIDGWTDDVNIGISAVNDWLEKKIIDPQAREIIRTLLKPDKNGLLKASRVLDLSKKAIEIGDAELMEHVKFIQSQYRPQKTSTFVKAKYKDENEVWQWVALSMSAV